MRATGVEDMDVFQSKKFSFSDFPRFSFFLARHVFAKVAGERAVEVAFGVFAFVETMAAIRVGDLGKLFVVIDEGIDHDFTVLVVAVVVASSID